MVWNISYFFLNPYLGTWSNLTTVTLATLPETDKSHLKMYDSLWARLRNDSNSKSCFYSYRVVLPSVWNLYKFVPKCTPQKMGAGDHRASLRSGYPWTIIPSSNRGWCLSRVVSLPNTKPKWLLHGGLLGFSSKYVHRIAIRLLHSWQLTSKNWTIWLSTKFPSRWLLY